MVPGAGLEPAWITPKDFKSFASTDFATRAGCARDEEGSGLQEGMLIKYRASPEGGVEAEPGIEPGCTALQAAA